ncbi:MAG: thymidine kinase, partial [Myxococcales bacterium]|nr:thymidine kinase [Myxococcales bacterium]
KTEELVRRVRRARIARQRVLVVKPGVDVRYAVDEVVTHTDSREGAVPIARATDLLALAEDADVVGVDEAQFFDDGLVDVAGRLADEGVRVIVAGLDMDYRGRPFGPVPDLMAVAEYVTKTLAVCTVCGAPASRTQRLVPAEAQVLLGAGDRYEARCRKHWDPTRFDTEQEALPLPRG